MSPFFYRFPFAFLIALNGAIAKEPPSSPSMREQLRIPAQASVGRVPLPNVKLELSCTGGTAGVLQVAVILPAPENVAGFPLDAFEGPDGIGQVKALATLSMSGPNAMSMPASLAGWRGVDGDGFLLASMAPSDSKSDLARLLRFWIEEGSAPLVLSVKAPQGGASLEVRAFSNDYRSRLRTALAPCDEPVGQ